MHEIYLIKNNTQTKITHICSNISWKDNIDTLGMELDFSIPNAYKDVITEGDLLVLVGNEEILRGIVVRRTPTKTDVGINAFDFAFYLNKSKEVYQFNTNADNAITNICNDFNVPVGNIVNIPTKIKHIYTGVVSDTIKDILEQSKQDTGIKYVMEMYAGKFYVRSSKDLIVNATFNFNGIDTDITKFITNPQRTLSIESMRNSIKIISGNEDSKKIVATAKDTTNISKYGLLQEVQSVDEKDIAKAQNIANNILKELNKVFEESSIEVMGNDSVRAGRILNITEERTGMSGQYMVKDCTHTFQNNIHRMNLGLEAI